MLKLYTILLSITLPIASTNLSAKVAIDDAASEKKLEKITQIITRTISRHNFKQVSLDDALSEMILNTFINDLDPNRSYFLAKDISEFEKYQNTLDDALNSNNIEPGYVIFDRYKERVNAQVDFALELLKDDFDFSIDEDYQYNREDEPWAKNQKTLDDTWRKRVKNDFLSNKLSEEKSDEEIKLELNKSYSNLSRRTNQLNTADVFQLFINAYTASVEPHTSYFSPRTSENFKIRMSLSLEGIGAVLEPDNEFTKVRSVVTGGPAASSELLKPDDRIIGVGQDKKGAVVNVIGWRLDDVVDLIRGPKGTTVRLQIIPKGALAGNSNTIVLVRDKIRLEDQAAKKEIIEKNINNHKTRIGIITLPTFYSDFAGRQNGDEDYRSTTRDVKRLLSDLEKEQIDGIVLDLRNNGGGSLAEANELTGLFIKTGPIVQILQADGGLNINRDPDPLLFYDGPLAVLVDRNSASASEILTGAIQDYRRGIIIGEPTFGKGTVQNLIDLNQLQWLKNEQMGQLKMTFAQFFRVNGDSTQYRGVIPDIIYPTAFDIDNHGERSLKNAIPWAQVEPAKFTPYPSGITNDFINELKANHKNRIKDDPGFDYLLTLNRSIHEIEKQKSISLLESQRREEGNQLKANRLARYNLYRSKTGEEEIDEETYFSSFEEDSELDFTVKEDVLLNEAINILNDFVGHNNNSLAVDISPIVSEIN